MAKSTKNTYKPLKKGSYKTAFKMEDGGNVSELNYSERKDYIEQNYAPFIQDAQMTFSIFDNSFEYDYKKDRKEVVKEIIEHYESLGDYTEETLLKETVYEIKDFEIVRRELDLDTDEYYDETELEEITSDNTYNFSYLGLVDLNWRLYYDTENEKYFYVIMPHLGGDIRGNYGNAIILQGSDKDDLFYRFYEGFISGGASIYLKFLDGSEIGFDSEQDSDVFNFRLNEVFEPTGMAQKYLNDFEKFDSWKGDEFLEETIDLFLMRNGNAPKMMAGGSLDDETPKAYIEILGNNNEGKWIDLTDYSDGNDVIDGISEWMNELNEIDGGNREEYRVADFEGFGNDMFDEYMGMNDFDEIIEAYQKYTENEFPTDVIFEYKDNIGNSTKTISDIIDDMENNYFGKYDDYESFGLQMVDEGVYSPSVNDVYITDTDKRILAGEEADAYVNDLSFEDALEIATDVKEKYDIEKTELEEKIMYLDSEIGDLELIREDSEDEEYEIISEQIEEKEIAKDEVQNELDDIDSRFEDEAFEEVRDIHYELIYDKLENDLEDWLSEYGYNDEDLSKINFLSVDYDRIGEELSANYLVIEYNNELYFFSNYEKGGRLKASKRKSQFNYYVVENSTKKLVSGYKTREEAVEQRALLVKEYPTMRFEIFTLGNLEAKTNLDVNSKKDYVELTALDKIKQVSVDAYRYGQEKVGQANSFLQKHDVKGKIKRGARNVADKTKQGANWLKRQWQEADFGDGKGKAKFFADGGGVELFRPTKEQKDAMKNEPFNPNISMENHKDFSKLGFDKTEYSPKLMNIGRWVDISNFIKIQEDGTMRGWSALLPYKIISLQKDYKGDIIYRGANQKNSFGKPIGDEEIKRFLTEEEALQMYNENIGKFIDLAYDDYSKGGSIKNERFADGGGVDDKNLQIILKEKPIIVGVKPNGYEEIIFVGEEFKGDIDKLGYSEIKKYKSLKDYFVSTNYDIAVFKPEDDDISTWHEDNILHNESDFVDELEQIKEGYYDGTNMVLFQSMLDKYNVTNWDGYVFDDVSNNYIVSRVNKLKEPYLTKLMFRIFSDNGVIKNGKIVVKNVKDKFSDGGGLNVGYNVFNYTDNIYATDEVFKTKGLANKFIKEFRNRFANQGYYRDNRMNKINIQDIDLLAIPSDFNPLNKYADGGMAGLGEVSGMLPSALPMSTIVPMANGGEVVRFYTKENERLGRPSGSIEKEILDKVRDRFEPNQFVGGIGWKTPQGKLADGYLYKLDDFDRKLVSNIRLKETEKIFRYFNRTTAIGGMTPLIKINIQNGMLYFAIYSENDDVQFETKGVKALWVSIIEDNIEYAVGGSVDEEVSYINRRIRNLEGMLPTLNANERQDMISSIDNLKTEREGLLSRKSGVAQKKSFWSFAKGGSTKLPKDNSRVHFTDDEGEEFDGIFIAEGNGNPSMFLVGFDEDSSDFRFVMNVTDWHYLDGTDDDDAHAKHEASETAKEEREEHEYDVYDNKRMLKNQAREVEHHSEELNNQIPLTEKVPAWLIAKMERATTDLSDVTHYLDGENNYADGGGVKTDYFIAVNNRFFSPYNSYYRVESNDVFNGKQVYYDEDGEAYTIDENNYTEFKSGDMALQSSQHDMVVPVYFNENDEDADNEDFVNNTHKHVKLIPNFNKYYGEWHKDKSDAEKELKSLENKFSDGGDIQYIPVQAVPQQPIQYVPVQQVQQAPQQPVNSPMGNLDVNSALEFVKENPQVLAMLEDGGKVGDINYDVEPYKDKFIIVQKTYQEQEDSVHTLKEFIRGFNGKFLEFDDIKSAEKFIDNIEYKYPYGNPKANAGLILMASQLMQKQEPKQPQVVYYVPQQQEQQYSDRNSIIQNIPQAGQGGEMDMSQVNDFCMTQLIELANELQPLRYFVTDRFSKEVYKKEYAGRLILVFKEPVNTSVVNTISNFIEKAKDCQRMFEQSVNVSGSEPNAITINILDENFVDREFGKGGKVYDNSPKKINLDKTNKITTILGDYYLGLITDDFVYYFNSSESDENSQTIMYNKKGELISDNYFATQDLMETLENKKDFEYIHPELENYRKQINQ